MKYETLQMQMIDFIKTNQVTKPLYKKLKSRENKKRFHIDSINTIVAEKEEKDTIRLNLVVPTMRATRVFAGISSALTFLKKLAGDDIHCRIIVISNEAYGDQTTYQMDGYKHEPDADHSLWFYNDGLPLSVSKNDIFIYTSWKTAVALSPVFKWQQEQFNLSDRKAVYLIQDYEPGFFAWSTEYVLAESTYSAEPDSIIAVFNSEELYTYFKRHDYAFAHEVFFKPNLNVNLKRILLEYAKKGEGRKPKKRKKQILIYGRPSEFRNAFELIRYSLAKWSETYPGAPDWEIVSLGEGFEDIALTNNTIHSFGKVSLDEYARYMFESFAGISLMVSPHPSYPPLEMSTFGVKTIVNQYENKDLSSFNSNIRSLRACSPEQIVKALSGICDSYETTESHIELNASYLEEGSLESAAKEVRDYIIKMLEHEKA